MITFWNQVWSNWHTKCQLSAEWPTPKVLVTEKSPSVSCKMERLLKGNSTDVPQKIVYLLIHWDLIFLISAIKENQSNHSLVKLLILAPLALTREGYRHRQTNSAQPEKGNPEQCSAPLFLLILNNQLSIAASLLLPTELIPCISLLTAKS